MDDRVKTMVGVRRRAAIGAGALLALASASLLPVTASAAPLPTPKVPIVRPAGVASKIPHAINALLVFPGDYVSMGWTLSLPGTHPATSVTVSDVVATIPLQCVGRHQSPQPVNLVITAPQTTVTLPIHDNAWHATPNPALAQSYQAKVVVGSLCPHGVLEQTGKPIYAAKLVSTDTKDAFALRFHSVDARTNPLTLDEPNPNTDCTSILQNPAGVPQCNAPWTRVTTELALAPPVVGGGTGTGGGVVGGVGGLVGGVTGATGKVVGGVVRHTVHRVFNPVLNAASAAAATPSQQPGGVSAATAPPAPLTVQPAPSQSAVLGPVPLPVPVIDSVATGVGGALPWKWFLLLALVDIALIVAIVVRRRLVRHDRLNTQ